LWYKSQLIPTLVKLTMLLTTTPTIEGKRITKYCGIIAGEAVLGANVLKDLLLVFAIS